MQVLPTDYGAALVLGAFGLAVLALVGITAAVALLDIRRELRSLRRLVRRDAFLRPPGAGDTGGIDRCPAHPTSKEVPK